MSDNTIGENIRTRRVELGMTQQELGERMGTSQTAISYWESGKRLPSIEVWQHLADILGLAGLFGGDFEEGYAAGYRKCRQDVSDFLRTLAP